jgi:IS30 family transposase
MAEGHLTLEEREWIAQGRAAGGSRRAIAAELGRSPSTISRELRRNRSRSGYFPSRAQQQAEQRRRDRPWVRKMERPEISRFVREKLRQYWSPDQIAGRAARIFKDRRQWVSRQTIYTWIHAQAARGMRWTRFLRRHGKKRVDAEKRGKLPDVASIAGRPKIAERRGRRGDWEGDTVHGAPGRGGLLTLVDRQSRFALLQAVLDLKSPTVCGAAAEALRGVPREARKTATFDNGKEFADHQQLSRQTGVEVYFALPYCSWQRGTNENTNGLIRQFYPKGTDLARQPASRIRQVQELLNHRPRRCLGYRTPYEAFTKKRKCCDSDLTPPSRPLYSFELLIRCRYPAACKYRRASVFCFNGFGTKPGSG